MIQINDRFFIGVVIDGKEYPLEATGFGSLQISTNVNFFLPTARIQLNDDRMIFRNHITLADYVLVEIYLGKTLAEAHKTKFSFRLFSYKVTDLGKARIYVLDLIYDRPKYFNAARTSAVTGTSAEAIKAIGLDCEFKQVETVNTTDKQVWLPLGAKNCAFAKTIMQCGYVNDNSCMVLCVTGNGTLRYKNLTSIPLKSDIKFTVGNTTSKSNFGVLASREISKAGVLNNLYGYRFATIDQNPTNEVSSAKHTRVNVRATSKALSVNKSIHTALTSPRTVFSDIGCGNVHPNFEKAKHQNKRLKAFQSFGHLLVVSDVTGVDLLDVINFTSVNTRAMMQSDVDTTVNGFYVVTGKTIYATGNGFYYEKFEITRPGLNKDASKSNSQLGT